MTLKKTHYLALAAIMLGGAIWLRGVTSSIYDRILTEDDRYYLPSAPWMRFFSVGANEAAADLVWIKTILYFGGLAADKWKTVSDASKEIFTVKYMLTAAELDPHFYTLYKRGAALTLFQRGAVTEDSLEVSVELLEKGLEVFPNDGDLLFDLGFLHYYEMVPFLPEDPNDPKRKFHREKGIQLIRQAALMGGGPSAAAQLSATLLKREGMDDLVVEHLEALLAKETDEVIRGHLIFQLKRAAGEMASREIARSEALLREWKEGMSYVPYDLYSILRSDISLKEIKDPLYWSNSILGIAEDDAEIGEDALDDDSEDTPSPEDTLNPEDAGVEDRE